MGMLMHHTLVEQDKASAQRVETKAEKPVEVPKAEETSAPAKRTGGRRKVSK